MKKEVGIWVDHRKAVIVTIENKVAVSREIISNMEKHVRFSSSTHSKTSNDSQGSTAEDVRDRQFDDHLGIYYESIVSLISDADSILIFGPGEAKTELGNQLEHNNLGGKIVGIESADKMTTRQITAKVQMHYR
jgi:stalled ribosome rescue protein Dom34